jgi:hypothetical protein
MMIDGVGNQCWWKPLKLWEAPGKWADSTGNDNPACFDNLAVLQRKSESFVTTFNQEDSALIQIRYSQALIPHSILNEKLQRNGRSGAATPLRLECVQSQMTIWTGDLCRCPIRPQKHARGHVSTPKGHRVPKDPDLHAFDGTQVGRSRQAIRAGTNYNRIA